MKKWELIYVSSSHWVCQNYIDYRVRVTQHFEYLIFTVLTTACFGRLTRPSSGSRRNSYEFTRTIKLFVFLYSNASVIRIFPYPVLLYNTVGTVYCLQNIRRHFSHDTLLTLQMHYKWTLSPQHNTFLTYSTNLRSVNHNTTERSYCVPVKINDETLGRLFLGNAACISLL